jgi:2-methylcitrate dehydratase PrpD
MSAQFSLRYSVAIRAFFRINRIDLYSDPKLWSDLRLISFIDKMIVEEDPDAPNVTAGRTTVVVELADGTSLCHTQETPRGSPTNPMSAGELAAKYRECTEGLFDDAIAQAVDETIDEIDTLSDIAPFVGLLAGRRS